MFVETSAPTRIDLAGGTLDIWPLYLFHANAQTVNCAITLRARCWLRPRGDSRISVHSQDTGTRVDAAHWSDARSFAELPLIGCLLRHFEGSGLDMVTSCDSPVGAGIAGSSALTVAVCAALARWRRWELTDDELLRIAKNVEAQAIGVPTGVQDYRPALYGGVSAVELGVAGVRRVGLDVDHRALTARLVLAYTGASRQSGINNWDIFKKHLDGDVAVRALFDRISDVASATRRALIASDWAEVGRQMTREWATRKQLAPGVTTPTIDALIEGARGAGARAAKVCGAGGGGCLVCYTEPSDRDAVRESLLGGGARVLDCSIDTAGLQVATDTDSHG